MLGEPLPESNLSVAEESVRNRRRSVTVFGAGHNLCFQIGGANQQKAPAIGRLQGLVWCGGEGGRLWLKKNVFKNQPPMKVAVSLSVPSKCLDVNAVGGPHYAEDRSLDTLPSGGGRRLRIWTGARILKCLVHVSEISSFWQGQAQRLVESAGSCCGRSRP